MKLLCCLKQTMYGLRKCHCATNIKSLYCLKQTMHGLRKSVYLRELGPTERGRKGTNLNDFHWIDKCVFHGQCNNISFTEKQK